MLKVNRLTGYSIMLMSVMLKESQDDCSTLFTASGLAKDSDLPFATVVKVLKLLAGANFIKSQRGIKGGYSILPTSETISFANIIETLEGPININDCAVGKECYIKETCPVKGICDEVNVEIRAALDKVKLKDIALRTKAK